MARQYSIAEARDRLPAIVHSAERGRPVQLTRRGKPVAVLMSIATYQRLSKSRPNQWEAIQQFRKTHDLSELNIDEIYRDVRDPDPGREFKW